MGKISLHFMELPSFTTVFVGTYDRSVSVADLDWDSVDDDCEYCCPLRRDVVRSGWRPEELVSIVGVDAEVYPWMWRQDVPVILTYPAELKGLGNFEIGFVLVIL
jgi:hypothetical protein